MRPKPFLPESLNESGPYVRDQTSSLVWHQCGLRTLYADTDRSQVVYHANYLKYFERAREGVIGPEALVTLWKDKGLGFAVYGDIGYALYHVENHKRQHPDNYQSVPYAEIKTFRRRRCCRIQNTHQTQCADQRVLLLKCLFVV